MIDLEQLLTEHLRRRAAAATPRYDLEGIEQGDRLESVADLDDGRPSPSKNRALIGLAAAVILMVALAAGVVTSLREPPQDETIPATGATPSDTAQPDAPSTPPSEDAPAPVERRTGGEVIVFQSRGADAGWDLAAQDPETGDIRTLVTTDGIVDCPSAKRCANFVRAAEWSPDGRWVGFTVSNINLDGAGMGPCEETTGLWVKSGLGPPRQLTTSCLATPPISRTPLWAWAPVGNRIAYAKVIDGTTEEELILVDPSDGNTTSLGRVPGPLVALEWAPDGSRIAYSSKGSASVIDADGARASLLSDSFDDVIEVAWSPNGSQLFVHDRGRFRIQVVNADGTDLHPVLEGKDACCETAWSPRGDRLLYMLSVRDGTSPGWYSQVWTVSPDGSNPFMVYASKGCPEDLRARDALPVWSPDGSEISYYACGKWVVSSPDGMVKARPLGGFAPADLFVPLVHRSWAGGGLSSWDLELIGQRDH